MNSIPLVNDQSFDNLVLQSDKPVFLIFCTDWSGICHIISSSMEELAEEFSGKVNFYRVDSELSSTLIDRFNVHQFPTVIFFKNHEPIDFLFGAFSKIEFREKILNNLLNR